MGVVDKRGAIDTLGCVLSQIGMGLGLPGNLIVQYKGGLCTFPEIR